jgi:GT2 family glycosyltransferase
MDGLGLFFTVYRRPQYFSRAIRSWLEVDQVRDLDQVHFFIEPTGVSFEQERVARQIPQACIHHNSDKYGVLENPYQGFTEVFKEGYDYVIIAEEDVVVTRDVLRYHSWCRSEYKDDPSVLAVCSYVRESSGSIQNVHRVGEFSPVIWGTWRDRWESLLGPTWDHKYDSGPVSGVEQGWDWNIDTRLIPKYNKVCVFPTVSRSDHIGRDGGTHMTPELFHSVEGWSSTIDSDTFIDVSEF